MALTLRAIGFADVRFGFQPPQSGSDACAASGMTVHFFFSVYAAYEIPIPSSFRGRPRVKSGAGWGGTRTAQAGCRSEHSRSEWPEGRAADAAS